MSVTGDRKYFCNTDKPGIATFKYNDDYLTNNGGKYANACYGFLNDNAIMDKDYYWILEYFNTPINSGSPIETYPIIGTRTSKTFIKPELYKKFHIENENPNFMITVYNERLPRNYSKELLPLKIKDIRCGNESHQNLINEYDDRRSMGLPVSVMTIGVPIMPAVLSNFTIKVKKCNDLGKVELNWPIPIAPWDINKIVNLDVWNDYLTKAYVAV